MTIIVRTIRSLLAVMSITKLRSAYCFLFYDLSLYSHETQRSGGWQIAMLTLDEAADVS